MIKRLLHMKSMVWITSSTGTHCPPVVHPSWAHRLAFAHALPVGIALSRCSVTILRWNHSKSIIQRPARAVRERIPSYSHESLSVVKFFPCCFAIFHNGFCKIGSGLWKPIIKHYENYLVILLAKTIAKLSTHLIIYM